MEQINFYVNNKVIYVRIERSSNKNMYLKLDEKKGLHVVAPNKVKTQDIHAFVASHISQFVKHQENMKRKSLCSLEEGFVFFFGVKHKVTVLTGFKNFRYQIAEKAIYLKVLQNTKEETGKVILQLLKKELKKYLNQNHKKWEKLMRCPPHAVNVVYKKSNWGSNNVSQRQISYNSQLAHFEPDVINYVIVHELAHHFEQNHNQNFWKTVGNYLPNFKKTRSKLKRF